MRFEKWHGIGNAYLVMEQNDLPMEAGAARVRRICHPDLGAGGDGILLIGDGDAARRHVRIFNPDGGEAEFSGNGTRIAAGYLMERDGVDAVEMLTIKGIIRGERHDGVITIDAGRAALESPDHVPGPGAAPAESYTFVSVGNPHCVIEVDDPDAARPDGGGRSRSSTTRGFPTAPTSSSTGRCRATIDPHAGLGARRGGDALLGQRLERDRRGRGRRTAWPTRR